MSGVHIFTIFWSLQEAIFEVEVDTAFVDFERVVAKDDKRVSFDKGNLQLAFESVSMCER